MRLTTGRKRWTQKMGQKENPKLINRRTSGQEQKQRTDQFFINKALQKSSVFEMTQIICIRKDYSFNSLLWHMLWERQKY